MALHKPEHRKWWYWASWPFLTVGFCAVFPFFLIIRGYSGTRKGFIRDWENWIDDPVDWLKEWLHCHSLPFNRQLNISFLMQNRETTWDVVRKHGHYSNCDPEDL